MNTCKFKPGRSRSVDSGIRGPCRLDSTPQDLGATRSAINATPHGASANGGRLSPIQYNCGRWLISQKPNLGTMTPRRRAVRQDHRLRFDGARRGDGSDRRSVCRAMFGGRSGDVSERLVSYGSGVEEVPRGSIKCSAACPALGAAGCLENSGPVR